MWMWGPTCLSRACGTFSIGPTGYLIAIDPQPYNCDRILSNAGLNGFVNMLVVVAAAGPKDGLVTLNNQFPHDKSKLSLSQYWPREETQQQFTVSMCRLEYPYRAPTFDRAP